jgi:hypothetical protein
VKIDPAPLVADLKARYHIAGPLLRYAAKTEGQSGSDHSGDAPQRPGHVIAARVSLTLGWFVSHPRSHAQPRHPKRRPSAASLHQPRVRTISASFTSFPSVKILTHQPATPHSLGFASFGACHEACEYLLHIRTLCEMPPHQPAPADAGPPVAGSPTARRPRHIAHHVPRSGPSLGHPSCGRLGKPIRLICREAAPLSPRSFRVTPFLGHGAAAQKERRRQLRRHPSRHFIAP